MTNSDEAELKREPPSLPSVRDRTKDSSASLVENIDPSNKDGSKIGDSTAPTKDSTQSSKDKTVDNTKDSTPKTEDSAPPAEDSTPPAKDNSLPTEATGSSHTEQQPTGDSSKSTTQDSTEQSREGVNGNEGDSKDAGEQREIPEPEDGEGPVQHCVYMFCVG